jgi:mRNA-degrading endonuclease toxin of MazEF toxin-antitoxin module
MQNEYKKAGEIYWCQYPLSDKIDKLKKRPVLVISNQNSNQLDDDYIVLPITRSIRSGEFSVQLGAEDIQEGLAIEGEIRCNKPFTVRNNLIHEWIGKLDDRVVKDATRLAQSAIDFNFPSSFPLVGIPRPSTKR